MKKIFKLLFVLPAILMTGCNDTPKDTSSSGEPEKQYPQSVLESKWGLEAAKASYDALGLAIPYIECDSFEFEPGVDEYGDPDIWFYCYYKTDDECNQAYNDYLTICANRGFSGEAGENTYIDYENLTLITYQIAIVDRVIQEDHGIELQFTPSTWNGKPCLGIYGFNYLYIPEDVFPQKAIDELFGPNNEIPAITGEGLTYDFAFSLMEDGDVALEVIVYGCEYTVEETFYNALLATQTYQFIQCMDIDDEYMEPLFQYPGYEMGFYYYCMSKPYNHIVIFEYDIENSAFIIDMFNIPESWE